VDGIPIFYDSNDKTVNAFEKYRVQIKEKKTSGVLVSVMGGRLSEGINFSDELARSIIVLGLPYPNIKAP
jgi:chromosome transmission fidelity protein 1